MTREGAETPSLFICARAGQAMTPLHDHQHAGTWRVHGQRLTVAAALGCNHPRATVLPASRRGQVVFLVCGAAVYVLPLRLSAAA
jgi:hypothetical protein